MLNITAFTHEAFGSIRTEIINGSPYFCAKDVATALGYVEASLAVRTHCVRGCVSPTLNYRGNYFTMIPESDVYRLIMRSNLPNALQFQDWVCEEVLPSIRQTGGYGVPTTTQAFAHLFNTAVAHEQQLLQQSNRLTEVESNLASVQHRIDSRGCREGYILKSDAYRRYGRNLSKNIFDRVIVEFEVPSEGIMLLLDGVPVNTTQVHEQSVTEAVSTFYGEIERVSPARFSHPRFGSTRFQA